MSKNVIHNFNLSIQNSADIKSAEHLTNVFIKELAKVSKEMSQQKDIVQIWQEQQLHNTITNDPNSSTEGGAIDNTAATIEKTALSTGTTPSANGDSIKNNTTSSTVAVGQVKNATSSLPDGGGVTDTTDKTAMRSLTSVNTTPPISEVENDTTNKGITSIAPQPYANVGTQESVRLPQHLKENNLAPTINEVKKGVQNQLNNAIKNNDTEAIKYWSDVLDKLEKGASIADYKNDPRFNLMYNELKPLGGETATFHWDNIRLKMIAAIESKILNDQISLGSKNYWNTILKELKNEQVNIANLFEQYDELFLLLREVEGLTELPNSITFFTKTKVYPNLSPDKMYANLGAQNVYAFLKELSAKDDIGAGVNKGAVFIKNTSAKTFILGESLEFGLNEKLVNQRKFAKENINWVVYLNNKKEKTFVNEGPNFSYNFEKLGNYIIEAYGEKTDAIKDKKHSAYVDINIIKPEIEIIAPTNFSASYARPFTEAKQFAVKLKANKAAKPKNPLQLFYQIEHKAKDKFVSISEIKPLSENGLFNVSLPKLGTYTVIVTSNGQYPINGKVDFKVKENYVKKISITKNFRKDNIYLKLEKLQQVEYKATEFLFNPATTEEMNNVKWVLYNEKELQEFNKENPTTKQPFAKGTKATFNLPLTEGKYWVEAYSNTREGKKSTSSQQIQVVHPTVTEANWTDASGTPKTTSGFIGEINYVKATVPNFCNEEVRIYFHVKAHKDSTYYKNRYFITTKTDSEGKINTAVSFSKEMKAKLGISNWNVNLKFALVGVVDNQLYAFKGISYPVSNAELKVTTKKEILDVYFKYQGKRLLTADRVPYGEKTTNLIVLAKTRNMVGDSIKFIAHQLNEDSILEDKPAVKIGSNGYAALNFVVFNKEKLKKGSTLTYYAGVEGFSTKHFKDKTLVLEVGAKWDTYLMDANDPQLVWGDKVSKEFRLKLLKICAELWGESRKYEMADAMMISMSVETGETFSSSVIINNNQPYSKEAHKKNPNLVKGKPVGLVQFTTAPIKSLILQERGLTENKDRLDAITTDEINKYKQKLALLSPIEQLDYVKKYFMLYNNYKKVQRPEDIYMVIFAPSATGKGDKVDIYKKYLDGKINPSYRDNSGMDTKNDGFNKGNNDGIIQSGELLARYREMKSKGIRYALSYNETRKLNQVLAEKIIKEKRIAFSNSHVSGVIDKAMAIDNIKDASAGKNAKRSDYGNAPGGEIELLSNMLYIMYMLSKDYTFNVSEIAGAEHSNKSRHYKGMAFDINIINKVHMGEKGHPNFNESFHVDIRNKAKNLGANKVLDPYNEKKQHYNHIHIEI
ncbi:hypothetical protein FVB9288_01767 [Flavobacterium sp. CECT 9288]|uniref:hypothetical protein n=1 Tax=Flavobacterium sp. CECT 9288 TaxID=2845819 RepID=UPI001E3F5BB8|nr:hypothetical protein [Flavobacterium sp. CECT 9288]CAH0336093.1 hypothetical protein FVB9288_01767 [Flavobacterium sp. CECT 9288]